MELRRPRLADKETVLEMMAEFEKSQSAHDGGFWNANNFVYEEWLEENLQAEAGLNIPENWVPAIQLVSFDVAGQALGFLNLRLRLNDYLLEKGAILATPFVHLKEVRATPKNPSDKVYKLPRKRISNERL
ncbi:acetyltransferase, gnat family [Streptococcus infantis SK1302]|uniref:Acetyltransferase, gnat family n=1 Tax=Streptococcus infantis SK1302 TaxID=871237 RepID=A0ABP2J523_9STRE|nr:acetyltransferase, gnat family [Streptococcus infantis SK1302]